MKIVLKILAGFCISVFIGCISNNQDNKSVEGEGTSSQEDTMKIISESLIKNETKNALEIANLRLKKLKSIQKDQLTFQNSVIYLETLATELSDVYHKFYFNKSTHENEKIRAVANKSVMDINKFYDDLSTDKEVYDVLVNFSKTKEASRLNKLDKRLLEDQLREYIKSGLGLSEANRNKYKKLLTEMTDYKNGILKNIAAKDLLVAFKKEELKGLSEDQLQSIFNKEKKIYEINLKTYGPGYSLIMTHADNPRVRKRIYDLRSKRVKEENKELIYKVVKNRLLMVKLFGDKYPSWADYKIEDKMAKSSNNATSLLNEIDRKLNKKFILEKKKILKIKKEKTKSSEKINYYDVGYFMNILKKQEHNVDQEKIKEYFPWDHTLKGMFEIYSSIFGLKIIENTEESKRIKHAKLYDLFDSSTNQLLGSVYIDPYPRTGKYNHFAMFPIVRGRGLGKDRVNPLCAVVGNWPKPYGDKPTLLKYSQVRTLFHEFGHAIHHISSKSKYASFSGTSVPRDFVEAPSQVLEYWLEDYEVIKKISSHYKTKKPLPKKDLKNIIKALKETIAHSYKGQVSYGRVDLLIHSYRDLKNFPKNPDQLINATNKILDAYYKKPADHGFITSFNHLFGGYDAGYYGYAWADIISSDIASKFLATKEKYFNKKVGMKLRKEIYEVGNTRDVNESISAFLGRKYNTKAFFNRLEER